MVQSSQRRCLKCGKMFTSAGSGNRICPRCNDANARLVMRYGLVPGAGRKRGKWLPHVFDDANTSFPE